jgi:hypothetical protein
LIDTNFSLLQVNARSLCKIFESLTLYLSCLKHKFSVIAVSETWTTAANQSDYKIVGYNHVVNSRVGRSGGGVALYVKDTLSLIERVDLDLHANMNFECKFIELNNDSFGTKIIGAVYRPPDSNLDLFRLGFDAVLDSMKQSKNEYIIAGDYNIDLLKHETHIGTGSFVNNLYSHSLIPLITRPTRFGKSSSTLIDNIFTNKPNEAAVSGILISDVSDHLPVFYVSRSPIINSTPRFKTVTTRLITEEKI